MSNEQLNAPKLASCSGLGAVTASTLAPNTTFHVALSVRGTLKNAPRRELASLFVNGQTGKRLTADEAKDALLNHLAKGHEVIPLAHDCQGFDYSGGGCPGHPETATLSTIKPPRDLRTQLHKDCSHG